MNVWFRKRNKCWYKTISNVWAPDRSKSWVLIQDLFTGTVLKMDAELLTDNKSITFVTDNEDLAKRMMNNEAR